MADESDKLPAGSILTLTEELTKHVALAAERLGMSGSEVVHAALHQFLYHPQKGNSVYLSAPER